MLAYGKKMPKNNQFSVLCPELIKNCPEKSKTLRRKKLPKLKKIYPEKKIYPIQAVQPVSQHEYVLKRIVRTRK